MRRSCQIMAADNLGRAPPAGYDGEGVHPGATAMWSVRLSVAARESLQTLPEEDREQVFSAIGRLTEGPTPPGLPRAFRLRNRPDLIVLPAGRYRVAYAAGDQD